MNAAAEFETETEVTATEVETAATEATTETPENQKNDKRKSALIKQVIKLGEEASLGRDSLPKLAHAVVKAAADGVIDGKDAESIYDRYAAAESKKAIHEHSAGGKKANVSKLKQLIEMGCMTTVDGVEVMQAAYDARENVIGTEGKVKSAYPFYVDVARSQLKADRVLSAEELEELAIKAGPADKTLEAEIKTLVNRLEALVTGENKHGLKDEDEATEAAFHLMKERLDKFATLRAHNELRAKAAELGLSLA